MKSKWFYPLQDKVKEYIKENYVDYRCMDQLITVDEVIETYRVYEKENALVSRPYHTILAVIKREADIITIYKVEDYIQVKY